MNAAGFILGEKCARMGLGVRSEFEYQLYS